MNEAKATSHETPSAEAQLFSLGWMVGRFQHSIQELRSILAAADVKPVMTLNEVGYYNGVAVIAVARALRGEPMPKPPAAPSALPFIKGGRADE